MNHDGEERSVTHYSHYVQAFHNYSNPTNYTSKRTRETMLLADVSKRNDPNAMRCRCHMRFPSLFLIRFLFRNIIMESLSLGRLLDHTNPDAEIT